MSTAAFVHDIITLRQVVSMVRVSHPSQAADDKMG
jgi:hypothetical protein